MKNKALTQAQKFRVSLGLTPDPTPEEIAQGERDHAEMSEKQRQGFYRGQPDEEDWQASHGRWEALASILDERGEAAEAAYIREHFRDTVMFRARYPMLYDDRHPEDSPEDIAANARVNGYARADRWAAVQRAAGGDLDAWDYDSGSVYDDPDAEDPPVPSKLQW